MGGGHAVQKIRPTFFRGWNLFVFYLFLLCPLLNHDFTFPITWLSSSWKKNLNIVSLVTLFVWKPLATEISALFLCSLELSMQKPNGNVLPCISRPKIDEGKGKDKGKKIIRRLSLSIPGPKTRVNMTEEVLKGRKLKYACIVGTLGCQASLQCHDFLVGPLPSIVTGTVSVNLPAHWLPSEWRICLCTLLVDHGLGLKDFHVFLCLRPPFRRI